MSHLRLYKDFYCINSINSIESYSLINVYELSANTISLETNDLIENLNITNESNGKYYVELDQYKYDVNKIYEVQWFVKYIINSPLKRLVTRFKLYETIVGQNIEMRLEIQDINIMIDNQSIELRNDNEQMIRIDNSDSKLDGSSDGIKLTIN
jgi:hypothetical protein